MNKTDYNNLCLKLYIENAKIIEIIIFLSSIISLHTLYYNENINILMKINIIIWLSIIILTVSTSILTNKGCNLALDNSKKSVKESNAIFIIVDNLTYFRNIIYFIALIITFIPVLLK